MQPVQILAFPESLLAAMPQLSEKPHLGVPSRNPAWKPGPNVPNSTAAIGLRAGLLLNRVRSHYTGKERDTESGNDYFGARYYASSMGRFMSPDPAGVRAVKLANPQTWNWYAYVINNPLRYTDPTGMYTCADDHNKCATDQDKAFEAARQKDLQSTDKGVAAAAKAYGDPTKDNHVGVQFTDAKSGNTSLSISTDGKSVTSQITV